MTIVVTVNGRRYERDVEPRTLLAYFLRESCGLTGTHVGCDSSSCGVCTVVVDGRAVKACTMFAVQAHGSDVTTVEGLANGATLHPLQQAFWDQHGLQCGYCTPGMLMTGYALLQSGADLDDDAAIRRAISGNLCRCTGYQNIVAAMRQAATALRQAQGDTVLAPESVGATS